MVDDATKELKGNKLNSIANTGSHGSMDQTQIVGGVQQNQFHMSVGTNITNGTFPNAEKH